MSKRIAFNVLSARVGAGVSALVNLLPHLARLDQNNSYIIFYSSRQPEFVSVIPPSFQKVVVDYLPNNPIVRIVWEQLIFPIYLSWYQADILYSVGNTTSIIAPCKVVLFVENSNPFSLISIPCSRKERIRHTLLYFLGCLSAWRATKIRFASANSRNLIAPQIKIPLLKCVVIPYGISLRRSDVRAATDGSLPYGQNYILSIGVNAPHRNVERLIKAFFILTIRYQYHGNLLVVGRIESRQYGESLVGLIVRLELQRRVMLIGNVPYREIESYYADADVLAFPSIEETFGIPLIEAMALGVAITASDCDLDPAHRGKCFNPFREICGDAAHYFNPFDVRDMAENIYTVISDFEYRQQLIKSGRRRVEKYHIENTAKDLLSLFEQL